MKDQIFKNQYTLLERSIVWLVHSLEFISFRQFDPSEKNDTWKFFWAYHPEEGKLCKFTPWKIYLEIKTPWKKSQ